MATFSLSGIGIETLSAGVGALHCHVDTYPPRYGSGSANPESLYKVGQVRAGNASAWWRVQPIDAEDCWIGIPVGSTRLGYAMDESTEVTCTEVFGDHPFRGEPGAAGEAGESGEGAALIEAWSGDGSATSKTFSSIPATYTHLRLMGITRTTYAAANSELYLRFNGDTGSNYDHQFVYGNAGAAAAGQRIATSTAVCGWASAANDPSGVYSSFEVTVLRYLATAHRRVWHGISSIMQVDSSGGLFAVSLVGQWRNTSAAITSLTVVAQQGAFTADSRLYLYGV
jgi:hypothetical protein